MNVECKPMDMEEEQPKEDEENNDIKEVNSS